MMLRTKRERRAVACRRRICRNGDGGPKGPPYGKFEIHADSPENGHHFRPERAGDRRSPLQQVCVLTIFARNGIESVLLRTSRTPSLDGMRRTAVGADITRPCRRSQFTPLPRANPRRGRRPRRPARSGINQLPDFGAFAAHPVHCRGDLRSPADDAAHEKENVGRWLAAAETAEMVMAAPRDRPTANLKSMRIRRKMVVISDSRAHRRVAPTADLRADHLRPGTAWQSARPAGTSRTPSPTTGCAAPP